MKKHSEEEKEKGLFTIIILIRQFSKMVGAIGIIAVMIMAIYAELDEMGRHYLGDEKGYITLAFVIFLCGGGLALFWYFIDFIESVKDGNRLKNAYTFIKAVALILATYGLFKFQYQNMHGEDSHSFIRSIIILIF